MTSEKTNARQKAPAKPKAKAQDGAPPAASPPGPGGIPGGQWAQDGPKPAILLVDDKPQNLLALEKLLEDPGVELVKALSGNEALGLVLERQFALILMDVQMPEMDGFETARLIHENEETRHVPIIFVTAISKEQQHVFKGYEAGAVDYLFKPLDPYILKSKVHTFLELHNQRSRLESMYRLLEASNQKILQQQKSVIEEERLKVLLQMAGATAHELRQPLTVLLGNIELLGMFDHTPEKQKKILGQIEDAGQRVADIVEMIQNIRRDETKSYAGSIAIIDIAQDIKVLFAEDDDADFDMIAAALRKNRRMQIVRARGVQEGVEALKRETPDLVLLDFYLSDGNGLAFMAAMEKEGLDIPVVVASGAGDEMIAAQMIQAGAYDYLSKNRIDASLLSRTITSSLEKARLKKETREARERIMDLSIRDGLTGLSNRRYFNEVLELEVERAKSNGRDLALCMVALDRFKEINESCGHEMGDMVLSQAGKMLRQSFRSGDLLFRRGGEEFAVILPDADAGQAKNACERFRASLDKKTFRKNGARLQVTVSAGVARIQETRSSQAAELLALADHALFRAREAGGARTMSVQDASGSREPLVIT